MEMGLTLKPGERLDAGSEPNGAASVCDPTDASTAGQDIAVEVQALLCEKLLVEVDSLETDLLEAGNLDSLTLVELLLHLEERFGIKLALGELEIDDFRSIHSIARLVAAQMRAPERAGPGSLV